MDKRKLYYGDNLDILRRKIDSESVDLCYIDPPFNSKRNYNQIYNNVGTEDRAQAQAFVDTWTWDTLAKNGLNEILANDQGRFTRQTVELIKGLSAILGQGSLLAYMVAMTLRIVEIHRALKPSGSFYLHCDPTASHYLKLVCDGVFCGKGGEYVNEIVWSYQRWTAGQSALQRTHDCVLFFSKSTNKTFNVLTEEYSEKSAHKAKRFTKIVNSKLVQNYTNDTVREKSMRDVWEISILNSQAKERLGYPTQKPEALLERIIKASSNEGDVVLDAFCGCGTTIAVAERLNRHWIGIDITYQSISLVLKRLEDTFGGSIATSVKTDGIPKDPESALALATRQDDRTRKEFEKWAVLTYTNNRGIINEKKGADAGIDGTVYFMTGPNENAKMVIQVKSGKVQRGDIAKLNSDMQRENAVIATLLTLQEPTREMLKEAKGTGTYHHEMMGRDYERIQIITIDEMLAGARMNLPLALEVLKAAERKGKQSAEQPELEMD
ncbi:MAG: restriction endonuclease [Holophagales bacterium]|jgi:site-specific DNA-methyltransferase (adenine-specific)|nr:restriction endonuclease [Holophagales bacterium]